MQRDGDGKGWRARPGLRNGRWAWPAAALVLVPLIAVATAANAGDEVVADRPGFSTGTATVPPGAWQLEMGIQSSYGTRRGDPDSFTAPLLNVRVGIGPAMEINVLWDGMTLVDGDGDSVAAPLVGLKRRLVAGGPASLSFLGYLGSESGRAIGLAALLWDRELGGGLGLFGTVQVAVTAEDGEGRATVLQPALGLNIPGGARTSLFVEVYGEVPLDPGGRSSRMADAGVAWLPRPDVQLDLNFGVPLDGRGERFVGAGIAIRR